MQFIRKLHRSKNIIFDVFVGKNMGNRVIKGILNIFYYVIINILTL